MKINSKNKFTSRRGYSLVEVLVSLLVLSIGLVMVASLMTANIKSSMNSRNQVIASELAQEGIELVQNINDAASVALATGTSYTLSYNGALSSTNQNSSQEKLYLDNNGFYNHSVHTTATKYLRKIDITVAAGGVGSPITVVSTVSWNGQDIPAVTANCTVANQCLSVTTVMISKK